MLRRCSRVSSRSDLPNLPISPALDRAERAPQHSRALQLSVEDVSARAVATILKFLGYQIPVLKSSRPLCVGASRYFGLFHNLMSLFWSTAAVSALWNLAAPCVSLQIPNRALLDTFGGGLRDGNTTTTGVRALLIARKSLATHQGRTEANRN